MATKIKDGDRIAIGHPTRKGDGVVQYPYTAFEYSSFAATKENPDFWLERQMRIGEAEHVLNLEGFGIAAHDESDVERIEVSLGDLIDFNGTEYLVKSGENKSVRLVPTA